MSRDTDRRGTVGAVIGWVLYAAGVVLWLYAIPLSVASKVGSSTISIENEMIMFAGVGFVLLSGSGLAVLTVKLSELSKATKTARHTFLVLAALTIIGWVVPAMS